MLQILLIKLEAWLHRHEYFVLLNDIGCKLRHGMKQTDTMCLPYDPAWSPPGVAFRFE